MVIAFKKTLVEAGREVFPIEHEWHHILRPLRELAEQLLRDAHSGVKALPELVMAIRWQGTAQH
ncbi:hypothetical protein D3C84_1248020 [compost metagenome]